MGTNYRAGKDVSQYVFLVMALSAWIFRPILVKLPGLGTLDDSLVAIAGAVILFLVPSGQKR